MSIRTDIAVEFLENKAEKFDGVETKIYNKFDVSVTEVNISTNEASRVIGKPIGKYITLEAKECFNISFSDEIVDLFSQKLIELLKTDNDEILVIGIGNVKVTPDALGPKAAEGVIATRHIEHNIAKRIGLIGLNRVSVLSPGVLGQTGIEISEIIKGVIELTNAKTVILIDALAAGDISRLGKTLQVSNTGLIPGSGVGNSRIELSKETLGVDCITVGVPTVVDASALCYQMTGKSYNSNEPFIVTQRDIDLIIENASKIISRAINIALQPKISKDILFSLM